MTAPFDTIRYQRALERWRALADRRLQHMTLLYETGRWRRYFTEEKFLDIIRETREAADRWHELAPEAAHAVRFAHEADEALRRIQPSPYATPLPEFAPSAA